MAENVSLTDFEIGLIQGLLTGAINRMPKQHAIKAKALFDKLERHSM